MAFRSSSRSQAGDERDRLIGERILVAEDEALIAFELEAMLVDAGAEVVGPAHSVAAALALAEGEPLSGALLDIRLRGISILPVVSTLTRRNIPFVIYTGQDGLALGAEWPACPVVAKPAHPRILINTVATTLRHARAASV